MIYFYHLNEILDTFIIIHWHIPCFLVTSDGSRKTLENVPHDVGLGTRVDPCGACVLAAAGGTSFKINIAQEPSLLWLFHARGPVKAPDGCTPSGHRYFVTRTRDIPILF